MVRQHGGSTLTTTQHSCTYQILNVLCKCSRGPSKIKDQSSRVVSELAEIVRVAQHKWWLIFPNFTRNVRLLVHHWKGKTIYGIVHAGYSFLGSPLSASANSMRFILEQSHGTRKSRKSSAKKQSSITKSWLLKMPLRRKHALCLRNQRSVILPLVIKK